MIETSTIDKLYLELSQFTRAKNNNDTLLDEIKKVVFSKENEIVKINLVQELLKTHGQYNIFDHLEELKHQMKEVKDKMVLYRNEFDSLHKR